MEAAVIPLFGDRAFDDLATKNMGLAYYIACRSVHPTGKPPVIQEMLAKKILQAAQTGERDPDRLASMAIAMLGPFYRDVSQHFGLIPNFFMSAPDAPEILERLWDFAKAAYFNNPIPSVFKERLFVYPLASVACATASSGTAASSWATATRRAITRPRCRPSRTRYD